MSSRFTEQMPASSAERQPLSVEVPLEKQLGGVMMNDFVKEQEVEPVIQAATQEDLLARYEKPTSDGWLVRFHELPEGVTAYNGSRTFKVGEVPHMLVREEGEGEDKQFTSRLSIWRLSEDGKDAWPAPISNLAELTEGKITQDPSYSDVNGVHVVTWVEVELNDPTEDPAQAKSFKLFKSVTAVGETLDKLERLTETVMVDQGNEQVRNVELVDTKGLRYEGLSYGRIVVTTRTTHNGEYKIHLGVADAWQEITTEFLESLPEIIGLEGLIVNTQEKFDQRWIGGNDMKALANDDISLALHTGRFEDNGIPEYRVYDGAHCIIELGEKGEPAQAKWPKIIARAVDVNISESELPSKRVDVPEVMYISAHTPAAKSGEETLILAGFRDAGEVGQMVPDVLKEWRAAHPEFADAPFTLSTYQQALAA